VTTTEANQISTLAADNRAIGAAIDDASYNVDADLNRDGVVNVFDLNILNGNWGAALADGRPSSTGVLTAHRDSYRHGSEMSADATRRVHRLAASAIGCSGCA
jgi:hypothetical protein